MGGVPPVPLLLLLLDVEVDVGLDPPVAPGGQLKRSAHSVGSAPQPALSANPPASVELATTIPQSALRIRTSSLFKLVQALVLDRVTYLTAGASG
jgi:hypothetical protein